MLRSLSQLQQEWAQCWLESRHPSWNGQPLRSRRSGREAPSQQPAHPRFQEKLETVYGFWTLATSSTLEYKPTVDGLLASSGVNHEEGLVVKAQALENHGHGTLPFTDWVPSTSCSSSVPQEMCQSLSRVQLFATPWTVACQAPLSTEFSRQEYWSGKPFLSPGDLPDPGIESRSPALHTDS